MIKLTISRVLQALKDNNKNSKTNLHYILILMAIASCTEKKNERKKCIYTHVVLRDGCVAIDSRKTIRDANGSPRRPSEYQIPRGSAYVDREDLRLRRLIKPAINHNEIHACTDPSETRRFTDGRTL